MADWTSRPAEVLAAVQAQFLRKLEQSNLYSSRHPDIHYTTTDHHERQVLDLYVPTTASSPSPVLVYVHGGAFKFGSKETPLLPFRQLQNGYTIAAINYRRSGEALFPAMVEDCKSAVRFIKSSDTASKYGLDANRVVVWGESAGGHAVALLGTTSRPESGGKYDVGDHLAVSSSVNGVVDYYGPTDFLQMDEHVPHGWKTHNDIGSPEALYLGAQITTIPHKVREADPCSYVKDLASSYSSIETCPQFFLAHGTSDKIVPDHMSKLLMQELNVHGVACEYLPVKGTDHVFSGISADQQQELDARTDAFLRRIFG